MGEVQGCVGKNGKGEDEAQAGAKKKDIKKDEENEVARGVIQRLRRGETDNECQREGTAFPDEELNVPNLEVPDNQ